MSRAGCDDTVARNMPIGRRSFVASLAAIGCTTACSAQAGAPDFSSIDHLAATAIARHQTPGAVVAIGHGGQVVFRGVYGNRALVPDIEPETIDTRFDMASLTKATITACAMMQFWELGAFSLDDPVVRFLPAFAAGGKSDVTIRHLMTHYSGLPPDLDLTSPWRGKDEAVRRAMASEPIARAGEKFIYSDINFITVGLLVEKFSAMPLDLYAARHVLAPLAMSHSGFLPDPALRPRIAPTQFDEDGRMLRGVVHDPTARRMGGVAGHAGLFSDAADMSLYAQSLMDRRAGRTSAFPLKPETVMMMSTPQQPPGKTEVRGLGWDIDTHYSSLRGEIFSKESFGHTGFTGTSLWMDPLSETYVIILTNRVHPDGKGSIVALRRDIATQAARALGIRAQGA